MALQDPVEPDVPAAEEETTARYDDELKCIAAILRMLKAQGPEASARIVAYIADRFEGGKRA